MLNYYEDPLSNKIYKITIKELNLISRLPYNLIEGFVGNIFNKANVLRKNPINKEYFDAIIDAIYIVFYNNIEPEFSCKEESDNFNNIIHTIYSNLFYTELIFSSRLNKYLYGNSPYKDLTLPFLVNREHVKDKFNKVKEYYPDLNSELINYNTIYDIFP